MSTVAGTVYLLHFDRPYRHARHYIGWTLDLAARLAEHARGQGARLLAVVRDAGIGWRLARTWPGTRARERRLKRQGGASRCCPCCGVRPRTPAAPLPAPAADAVAEFVPAPRVPAYDRGAARARVLIGRQVAAGMDAARIGALHEAMFRDYDPDTARPSAREWHRGYQDTAAALIPAGGAPVNARTEPTAGELAAIEAEWPLIEAELAVLDAQITAASASGWSPLDWHRLRRAQRQVLTAQRRLSARTEPVTAA